MDNRYIDISFNSAAPLTADTLYWVAIAADSDPGETLRAGFHNDYNNAYNIIRQQIGGFSGTFPDPANSTAGGDNAYWFRLYNSDAVFLGGPQGPTGPTGPSIDISGGLDLSCNPITDVSGIYFCDGTFIGEGSSFDISTNQIFKINVTDISNAFVVDPSGNVGIGTNLPTIATNLDIADTGAAKKPGLTFKRVQSSTAANSALGTIDFAGTAPTVDDSAPRVGASIQGCASELWPGLLSTNSGADLRFFTTINGSGGVLAFHEMVRFSNEGHVCIASNTVPCVDPPLDTPLYILTAGGDPPRHAFIKVEISGSATSNNTAGLELGNFPSVGNTDVSSNPIGAIIVKGIDAGVKKNISQINSFLIDNTAGAFTSNVEFKLIADNSENTVMEMRGADTTTGSFPANGEFGDGLLYRSYTKRVGTLGPYNLTDADSGMHIWASNFNGNVFFNLPGNGSNAAQS